MDFVINRLAALSWPTEVSRPAFETDYLVFEVNEKTIPELTKTYGIAITGGRGINALVVSKALSRLRNQLHITFSGQNSICLLEEGTAVKGAIDCGSNSIAVILGGQHALNLSLNLYDGGTFFWGRGARTYGCRVWTHGSKRVVVGDDCLFSEGITIRTSDHHSIIDLDGLKQLNKPEDVIIGRHVWVSPDVRIMPGVTVGTGAILGVSAVVTNPVPAKELWVGVPARCVRKNVSWVDSHPASQGDLEKLHNMLGTSD